MIIGVPWRMNDEDPKVDGESLRGDVVVMDKHYRDKLEREEDLSVHDKVPRMAAGARRNRTQTHTEQWRKRIETELRGTGKSEAAETRKRQYFSPEGGGHEQRQKGGRRW